MYASSPEKHEERLQAVLNQIDQSGLKLNYDKCHFRKAELSFLGHVISEKGMSPYTEHVVAVTQAPPPKDASALCSFLGLTSWYSKFIPNYAIVVEPLRA